MPADAPHHFDQPRRHAECGEHDATPLVDLDRLGPAEIMALDRSLRGRQREYDNAMAVGRVDDGCDEANTQYVEALNTALTHLPARDPEHARAVYTAFADSSLEEDRLSGASIVDFLVEADRDHGLVLWDRLLRDPSPAVRLEAYDRLGDRGLFADTPEQSEQARQRLGIGWYDVARLLDAYIRAEHGIGIYELGEVALRRVASPPSLAD